MTCIIELIRHTTITGTKQAASFGFENRKTLPPPLDHASSPHIATQHVYHCRPCRRQDRRNGQLVLLSTSFRCPSSVLVNRRSAYFDVLAGTSQPESQSLTERYLIAPWRSCVRFSVTFVAQFLRSLLRRWTVSRIIFIITTLQLLLLLLCKIIVSLRCKNVILVLQGYIMSKQCWDSVFQEQVHILIWADRNDKNKEKMSL